MFSDVQNIFKFEVFQEFLASGTKVALTYDKFRQIYFNEID